MSRLADTFTDIAVAILAKTGGNAPIKPGDMPAEILGIQSGGGSEWPVVKKSGISKSNIAHGDRVIIEYGDSGIYNGEAVDIPQTTALADVSFSGDGRFLAYTAFSPRLVIYEHDTGTLERLDDPTILPAGQGRVVQLSNDGNYLYVGHNGSPFITTYRRDGKVFEKLPDPDILPYSIVYGLSASADGMYLVVSFMYNSEGYWGVYKLVSDRYTLIGSFNTIPWGGWPKVSLTHDGLYLSIAFGSPPYGYIYKRNNDTFVRLLNGPFGLPSFTIAAFSGDGRYWYANGFNGEGYMFKRNGDSFIRLDNLEGTTDNVYSIAFDYEGKRLALGNQEAPHHAIYKREGDSFIKLPNPNLEPSGTGVGASITNDGLILGMAYGGSAPMLAIYRYMVASYVYKYLQKSDIDSKANEVGFGYATSAAAPGEIVTADIVF